MFKKYFLTTVGIFILSLTVMIMILTVVFNDFLSDSRFESLNKACRSAVEIAQNDGLDNFIPYVSKFADYDLMITDRDGQIQYCSCEDWINNHQCRHTDLKISTTVLQEALKQSKNSMQTLGIYAEPHYVSSAPIKEKDENAVAVAFVTAPVKTIRSLLNSMVRTYLISAIVPVIIMFFLLYTIYYRMTLPIRLMSAATKAMARGDFSKRIPVTSDDEIGELAVSFNQMTNSLAQSEKMRRSFVANVSHELKTPMTTIGGFIDGIMDGTIEPEKQNYYLGIVSDEIKRLSRLVQSMLSIAKLESGELQLRPEEFNFRELLIQVVIGQEQRIEKKQIQISGLDELPDITVNADKDLMHQVVYNLVDNAIKFTPENGVIDFKLSIENKKMVFILKNTGKGIPPEALPYVFDRFYKVDKSRSAEKNSTGLGLYIVKTIVLTHGGTVNVQSKENESTAFQVVIPLIR
ncbi:MAG: HAMP domain-containing histidine kinase [Clostridia bacterium]|nr:HAMP domain-containing histidine kinase [Clostridia bacterium]